MSRQKEMYFKNLTPSERTTALNENADAKYSKSVVRDFSEDELTEMKTTLSEVSIILNDTEIEKKEMTAEVNERIKMEKNKRSILLRDLKNKYYENNETVYDIADQEEGTMSTFDFNGNLLSERKLTPKEKQTKLLTLNTKTA